MVTRVCLCTSLWRTTAPNLDTKTFESQWTNNNGWYRVCFVRPEIAVWHSSLSLQLWWETRKFPCDDDDAACRLQIEAHTKCAEYYFPFFRTRSGDNNNESQSVVYVAGCKLIHGSILESYTCCACVPHASDALRVGECRVAWGGLCERGFHTPHHSTAQTRDRFGTERGRLWFIKASRYIARVCWVFVFPLSLFLTVFFCCCCEFSFDFLLPFAQPSAH